MSHPGNCEIDEATIVVGLPKHGKSTVLRKESLEFLQTYPTGLVLAHDVNEELVPDITRAYEDTNQWREAYARAHRDRKPFPGGASFRCSSVEVGALVLELGRKHNRAKDVRVPIKYALDENSLSDTSGPTYQGDQDRVIWTNRRHLGCAPFLNTQVVSDVNIKFWRQATKVVIFSLGEEQARDLESKLSLPRRRLDELVNAPKFRFLVWRQGEGIVNA